MSATSKLTIDMPQGFRNELKTHAGARGQSISDYVVDVLTESIQQDAELGARAEAAKAEGILNVAESEQLLTYAQNSKPAKPAPPTAD